LQFEVRDEIGAPLIVNVDVALSQVSSPSMVPSRKLFLQLLLLLSTFRVAVAVPISLQKPNELNNDTSSQTSTASKTETHPRRGGWKAIAPYLGAVTILAFLGGLAYFGTRHDETHNEALAAHKREQFRKIVESGSWEPAPELAESVTSEELRAIGNAGKSYRDRLEKLEKEKEKLEKEIEEKSRDIILAYHDQVSKVQDKHAKNGG
jgi:hypothetical protein